jgi:hypothetical protein
MTRKAIVDKDIILNLLREGKTTQYIAEKFGVSRQAVDLHRRGFISRGLLQDQRAPRTKRVTPEAVPPKPKTVSLDDQIELFIEAFNSLKRLPELEIELEIYKRKYEHAVQEIERLQQAEQKRQDQELRWLLVQRQRDIPTSSEENDQSGKG